MISTRAKAAGLDVSASKVNPVAMPKTLKAVGERLDELKALGITIPEDADPTALRPLLGMGTDADLIRERVAHLEALGVSVPEGVDPAKLGPLLGLGPKTGVASEETLSIRAADFLNNHDPSGGNWIRMNKPVGGTGGGIRPEQAGDSGVTRAGP